MTATAIEDLHRVRAQRNRTDQSQLVGGSRDRYRQEFNDTEFSGFTVSTGAGMAVTTDAGYLTVTTGTTAGSETTIVSERTFLCPFKASFGFAISQKIANQEFYLEIVALDDDGALDESCVAAWRVAYADDTTTTAARVETNNGGAARSTSPTYAGVPAQTQDAIYEVILEADEARFHVRPANSTAARPLSVVRNTVAPDPDRRYVLRYRVVNGATAPASTTTVTSSHVAAADFTSLRTEISGGTGAATPGQSLPVYSTGGTMQVSNALLSAGLVAQGTVAAKVLSAATTNPRLVKASPARVYGYHLANTATAWRYVKVYNTATAPTVGTTAVAYTIPIAPGSTAQVHHVVPIHHDTGLSYGITAGAADTDATIVAAGDVVGHVLYA